MRDLARVFAFLAAGQAEPKLHRCGRVIIQRYEFHELVGALLPFTRHMLRQQGSFLPLGGIIRAGDVVLVTPEACKQLATVQAWIDDLTAALREHTSEPACVAVAYCVGVTLTDVRNGRQIDAVQIVYEHRCGEATHAFFPYKKKRSRYLFDPVPMLRISDRCIFGDVPGTHIN